MSATLIILLVGFAYVVLLGGLALLRREGLSMRFAVESVVLTLVISGLAAATGAAIDPVLFVILLYLVTMRVRLLVDIGNMLAQGRRTAWAGRVYDTAGRLWPDASSGLILQVNRATLFMQDNKLDDAIALFTDVLRQSGQGYLGVKYEAAAHFNLAVAYLRKDNPAKATIEFNAVIDTWPASLFARRAQDALNRLRAKETAASVKEPTDHPTPQS